ncbi:hypothetical protein TNCT_172261 [Trichonephila clavata]|uniref:Uncharacterized protein n=1 Tax=Trichonephila clavata TaxID=2740835 RepID=A0A8X6GZA0_TRICU|nr:hypothetical protein TNCT_172261 [Trichonephila clavata]
MFHEIIHDSESTFMKVLALIDQPVVSPCLCRQNSSAVQTCPIPELDKFSTKKGTGLFNKSRPKKRLERKDCHRLKHFAVILYTVKS